jgi:RNA polymerase-binding transcription factor DksA
MTGRQAETYRQKLLALTNRVNGDLSQLAHEGLRKVGGEASGNLSNTPLHLADLGADHFEQEVTLGLMEIEGQTQREIAAAVGRIDAGTFGRCEDCGKAIPAPRLDAVPYTRYCAPCAQAVEAGRAG